MKTSRFHVTVRAQADQSRTGKGSLLKHRGTPETDIIQSIKSGCMRGNDRYGNNGSASIGISQVREEPKQSQLTYSEFIHFDYGQPSQRQYGDRPEDKKTRQDIFNG